MIVHVHTGRDWGGGEDQVSRLVRGLVSAGQPTVLLARGDGSLMVRARALDLPVRALPPAWRWPGRARPLARALADMGATLLHGHDSGALSLCHRLRRTLAVPLVLSRRIASPLRANHWSRAKYSAERIDTVIAISNVVRDVFCASGFPRARVVVVPSGLDLDALERVRPAAELREGWPSGHVVAGIGKLAPKKNWGFLVRTAAAVARTGIDVQWVLVGDGPERSRLEHLVRAEGLADRVHLVGFQHDAERWLRASDLLFFPSLREGASITVRQAMAMGVPVVAANAPGTVESLDGHGWVISAGDVGEACEAVVQALTDDRRRQAAIAAARESARQRFAFERTLDGTLAVYRSMRARPQGCSTSLDART